MNPNPFFESNHLTGPLGMTVLPNERRVQVARASAVLSLYTRHPDCRGRADGPLCRVPRARMPDPSNSDVLWSGVRAQITRGGQQLHACITRPMQNASKIK